MATGTAPVCLLQPDIKIEQPDPRLWPPIPPAHDLASALRAINAMRNLLQQLMDLLSHNNLFPHPPGKRGGFKVVDPKKQAAYQEVHRTTKVVRVYNPQDKSQYVDVEQIESLLMRDTKTGEVWAWKR